MNRTYDTLVIGAGQAGLAAGYYLQRARARFALLDAAEEIGSAWKNRWDSLRLFTPARYSNLPGMRFPGEPYSLPTKDEAAEYLKAYARHFELPVHLRTQVTSLRSEGRGYVLTTAGGESLRAASLIIASGATQPPMPPPLPPGWPRASSRFIPAITAGPRSSRKAKCSSSAPATPARRSRSSSRQPAARSCSRGRTPGRC